MDRKGQRTNLIRAEFFALVPDGANQGQFEVDNKKRQETVLTAVQTAMARCESLNRRHGVVMRWQLHHDGFELTGDDAVAEDAALTAAQAAVTKNPLIRTKNYDRRLVGWKTAWTADNLGAILEFHEQAVLDTLLRRR